MSYRKLDSGDFPDISLSSQSFPSLSPSPPIRIVSRTSHHLNVKRIGTPSFSLLSWYHSLLDYSWFKFVLVMSLGFIVINLIFGGLFFIEPSGIEGIDHGRTLSDFFLCYCFSAQTITTIGYGKLAPNSYYIQVLVLIESFGSFLLSALITGVVFAKISKPTRLRKEIMFSDVAVVNRSTGSYVDGGSCLEVGKYVTGKYNVLCLRAGNTRRSQLCAPQVRLLLLHKSREGSLVINELDYEIYPQLGRPRGINYAVPYLAFPWTITHTIDEKSPLFKLPPVSWSLPENHFELIVILDGVDESVSMNVQARWSYIPSEIILSSKFVEITTANEKTGEYEVDFTRLSDFTATHNINNDQNNIIN